ncbi:transmembrane protein [Aureococcus anophagefferens]|uniref:Transmembrane protein n=1 Tax=Aureococcus anophagefferens TaxID=44056 RepID=A0ABR1G0E5_AURAN
MAPLRRARPLPARVAARRRCATTAPESKAIEPPSRAQLWRLALNVGVPFVGFGFADNLIMILAGDAIDNDIAGIGAGDVIERYANVILGKSKSKPLTTEQLTHRASRAVKGWASAVGISVGRVIGMFPLLFLGEKKELYFTSEEMALYESVLRPYGVSPQNFFSMMRLAVRLRRARKDMGENPAIEAAILNILYFDLVEGLRRRGQYDFSAEQKKREPKSAEERTATYALLMLCRAQGTGTREVVLSDGVVHATEREFLSKYVIEHSITEAEHRAALASQGWTSAQWDAGVQDGTSTPTSQIRTAIPGLLKQAGIKSRITKASATDDDAAPPPHKGGK